MANQTSTQGLRAFFIIWISQLVSLVGSQLTGFALGVWVYDQTGSVMMLAVTQIALSAPQILLSPLADYVFKPGMSEGGALAFVLGPVVGVGANHGIGVLISVLGLAMTMVCVLFFFNPRVRNVEIDLPDHIVATGSQPPASLVDQPAD